jgi:hypothetical protein
MRYLCLALLLLGVGASAQKARKTDVDVLEAKCRRGENTVMLDGKVRVTAEKGLKSLTLVFDFIADSGDVLTTQKTEQSDEPLGKGEESAFHVETNNPPGAIKYRIRAFDIEDRELRIGNPGPFVIE